MYGQPLERTHGAPLRINMPSKLGYKSSKYLISLKVSNILSKDKGFRRIKGTLGLEVFRLIVMAEQLLIPTLQTIEKGQTIRYAYQHPLFVRLTHWLNAIVLIILIMSGLEIFSAFPSFGEKIPQHYIVAVPSILRLGGSLNVAIQWHFTFMWLFMGIGVCYLGLSLLTGYWRQVIFLPKDLSNLFPMIKHYFLFKPKPPATEPYNALQKLAYTVVLGLGISVTITGLILYKSMQLSGLLHLLGGFQAVRLEHFLSMLGLLLFIPGHLIMVFMHGWQNFYSIIVGWKKNPEYLPVAKEN